MKDSEAFAAEVFAVELLVVTRPPPDPSRVRYSRESQGKPLPARERAQLRATSGDFGQHRFDLGAAAFEEGRQLQGLAEVFATGSSAAKPGMSVAISNSTWPGSRK